MESEDAGARWPNPKLAAASGAFKYGLLTLTGVFLLHQCGISLERTHTLYVVVAMAFGGAMVGAYGGRYWMLLANDALDGETDAGRPSASPDNSSLGGS